MVIILSIRLSSRMNDRLLKQLTFVIVFSQHTVPSCKILSASGGLGLNTERCSTYVYLEPARKYTTAFVSGSGFLE
jgi:hypothetical protein